MNFKPFVCNQIHIYQTPPNTLASFPPSLIALKDGLSRRESSCIFLTGIHVRGSHEERVIAEVSAAHRCTRESDNENRLGDEPHPWPVNFILVNDRHLLLSLFTSRYVNILDFGRDFFNWSNRPERNRFWCCVCIYICMWGSSVIDMQLRIRRYTQGWWVADATGRSPRRK